MTYVGRALVTASLLVAGVLIVAGLKRAAQARDPAVLAGKALFAGSVPLKAHMVGHAVDLPTHAVRCANCHAPQALPGAAGAPSPTASGASGPPADIYAALLTREALAERRPRRGGPPSRYDASSFCRLLRDGIDPAHVIIAQSMPRYRVTDQECHQLWSFVTHE